MMIHIVHQAATERGWRWMRREGCVAKHDGSFRAARKGALIEGGVKEGETSTRGATELQWKEAKGGREPNAGCSSHRINASGKDDNEVGIVLNNQWLAGRVQAVRACLRGGQARSLRLSPELSRTWAGGCDVVHR